MIKKRQIYLCEVKTALNKWVLYIPGVRAGCTIVQA